MACLTTTIPRRYCDTITHLGVCILRGVVNLSVGLSLASLLLGVIREFLSPNTGPRPVELLLLLTFPGTGIRDTDEDLLTEDPIEVLLDLPGLEVPGTGSWLRLIL